jgi:hypothetical protein
MLDRRYFLIGVGSLLTATFVRKATAFSRKASEPLILPLGRKAEETLYIHENPPGSYRDYGDYDHDGDDYDADGAYYNVGKWRVSLGPDQPIAPPPPTWREYLRSRGWTRIGELDLLLPKKATSSSPPLPVKAGWRGRSPLWMHCHI